MEHEKNEGAPMAYDFQTFLPLITIFGIIIALTGSRQMYEGFDWRNAMTDFMGFFFIIFGAFKLYNWHGFVNSYMIYDIIAKRSQTYAYIYPLIELALGIAFLARYQLVAISIITLILMIISSIGVAIELSKGNVIVCACLGAVFKLPMTYVTLLEDLIMASMAVVMLLY